MGYQALDSHAPKLAKSSLKFCIERLSGQYSLGQAPRLNE